MGLSRMGELEEMRGAGVRNERQGEGSVREVGRTGEGESRKQGDGAAEGELDLRGLERHPEKRGVLGGKYGGWESK